jgi:hypothetical protein
MSVMECGCNLYNYVDPEMLDNLLIKSPFHDEWMCTRYLHHDGNHCGDYGYTSSTGKMVSPWIEWTDNGDVVALCLEGENIIFMDDSILPGAGFTIQSLF